MRYCNRLLYGERGFKARCIYIFGVEHSHHDLTAERAVKQGIAVKGSTYVKRAKRETEDRSTRQNAQ